MWLKKFFAIIIIFTLSTSAFAFDIESAVENSGSLRALYGFKPSIKVTPDGHVEIVEANLYLHLRDKDLVVKSIVIPVKARIICNGNFDPKDVGYFSFEALEVADFKGKTLEQLTGNFNQIEAKQYWWARDPVLFRLKNSSNVSISAVKWRFDSEASSKSIGSNENSGPRLNNCMLNLTYNGPVPPKDWYVY